MDEIAAQTEKPTRLVGSGVGSALFESKGCRLRFAYTHAHALRQQQQQGMEFDVRILNPGESLVRSQ